MGGTFKCCRGCGKRTVGCHSWCKRYIAEKKKHDELMEAARYDVEIDNYRSRQCAQKKDEKAMDKKRRRKRRVR